MQTNTSSSTAALGPSIVLLLGITVISWYFAPLAAAPVGSTVVGWPDGWLGPWMVWVVGGWCQQLAGIISGAVFRAPMIFAPGGAMIQSLPLGEAVVLPLRCALPTMSATSLFSLIAYLVFLTNFLGAFFFFRFLSRNTILAAALGVLLAMQPSLITHLRAGEIGIVWVMPLVLYTHLLLLGLEEPERTRLVRVGLSVLALILVWSDAYYFLFALLFTISAGMVLVVNKRITIGEYLHLVGVPVIVGLATFIVKFIAVIVPIWQGHLVAVAPKAFERSADIASILLPGPGQLIGSFAPLAPLNQLVITRAADAGNYVGFALIAITIWTMICYRRAQVRHPLIVALPWLALVCMIIALGPQIQAFGAVISQNYPSQLVISLIPLGLDAPARFAFLGTLLLSTSVALQLPGLFIVLSGQNQRRILLGLIVLLFVEYIPGSLTTSSLPESDALVALRRISGNGIVLDATPHIGAALARQMIHGKKLVNGPGALVQIGVAEDLESSSILNFIQDPRHDNLDDIDAGLEQLGVSWVIVTRSDRAIANRFRMAHNLKVESEDQSYIVYQRY